MHCCNQTFNRNSYISFSKLYSDDVRNEIINLNSEKKRKLTLIYLEIIFHTDSIEKGYFPAIVYNHYITTYMKKR